MFYFYLKEAVKSIGRAKTSFFFSVVSTMIAVFMLTGSVVIMILSDHFEKDISEKITIHLFINENEDQQSIKKIREEILKHSFVNRINFISKEDAVNIFIERTGEDFRSILDLNPLPASFDVTLKENFFHTDSIQKAVNLLEKVKGIDEVVFQEGFILRIMSAITRIKIYIYIFTVIILLISVYIVYSTSRLVLNLKKNEIETMKLVGATISSIKTPILFNGIIVGIIAGTMNGLLFSLMTIFLKNIYLKQVVQTTPIYLIILAFILLGIIIGVLSTSLVLRKITLRI